MEFTKDDESAIKNLAEHLKDKYNGAGLIAISNSQVLSFGGDVKASQLINGLAGFLENVLEDYPELLEESEMEERAEENKE